MKTDKKSVHISSKDLSDAQKEEMWEVYKRYYSDSKDLFMLRIPKHPHFSLKLVEGKITGFIGLGTEEIENTDGTPSRRFLYTPELA